MVGDDHMWWKTMEIILVGGGRDDFRDPVVRAVVEDVGELFAISMV